MSQDFYYTHHVKFHESSVLSDAYYNCKEYTLFVCFLSGSIAGYSGVPQSGFDALSKSESPGRHYNFNVKGWYTPVAAGEVYFHDENRRLERSSVPTAKTSNVRNSEAVNYVVLVHVDGSLEFTVPADDAITAITKVEDILKNSSKGDSLKYTIEGVSKS